jgi:NAD(P)H-hydrate repair Nnr-like enzyme with NAD(P)H-hydrate dehydratase domain
MSETPFERQIDKPLYPDILWNRPLNFSRAGRLLIIGGHEREFALVQAVYQAALAAGVGTVGLALPDSLRGPLSGLPEAIFLPSSPSGSLGKAAQGELLHIIPDYDAAVIGPNLSNNSESATLIEAILQDLAVPAIVTEEAIEAVKFNIGAITSNPRITVATTMNGVFTAASALNVALKVQPERELLGRVDLVSQVKAVTACNWVIIGREIIVAADDQISMTPAPRPLSHLEGMIIGVLAAELTQNFTKPYQALTTGSFLAAKAIAEAEVPSISSVSQQLPKVLAEFEN